jgi:hypothetical protein
MFVAAKPNDFAVHNDHPIIGVALEFMKRRRDRAHVTEDVLRVDAARR